MRKACSKQRTLSGRVELMMTVLALLACCAFSPNFAIAEEPPPLPLSPPSPKPPLAGEEQQFYLDAKQGWFWYEEPLPETEEAGQPPPQSLTTPTMDDHTSEELWNMHPDDFQALLMAFQKKAVQTPSEENVLDYLTMQDIARRKAAAYANVASYVIQKNPALDLGRDYPVTAPGVVARIRMQNEEVNRTILAAGEDHALLYFTRQSCPYCVEQRQILGFFIDRYGWQMKAIDVDEQPATAARFGITTTPSLLLINRHHQDFLPVGVGVISLNELEQKLYRAVRLLGGDITPTEYSVYEFQKGGGLDPGSLLKQ